MATNKTSAKKKPTTKSRVGGTSLARKKKSLLTPRNGLFAAVGLAVVGIVAVALSHASATPDYQYSFTTGCGSAASATPSCKDKSAEALVYRLYMGATGAAPSAANYAVWVQKLAGDRVRSQDAANLILASTIRPGAGMEVAPAGYVEGLYTKLLLRPSDTAGKKYWVDRLTTTDKKKKMTRARALLAFATLSEGIKRSQAGFNTYVSTAAAVTVKPVAADAQAARLVLLKAWSTSAKKNYEDTGRLKSYAQARYNEAKFIAAKPKPTRADLDAIASKQHSAEANLASAQAEYKANNETKSLARKTYIVSENLSKFATDIPLKPSRYEYDRVALYTKGAYDAVGKITQTIKDISGQYSVAEKKYQAELAHTSSTPTGDGPGGTVVCADGSKHNTPYTCPASSAAARLLLMASCKTQTGSHTYDSSYRHVRYGYNYKKVYSSNVNGCIEDASTYVVTFAHCYTGYHATGENYPSGLKCSADAVVTLPKAPYAFCSEHTFISRTTCIGPTKIDPNDSGVITAYKRCQEAFGAVFGCSAWIVRRISIF